MAYTDIDKPSDYFNTVLYTGNGSTQSITGFGHAPDLIWTKERNNAKDHSWYDSVRGANQLLESNNTGTDSVTSAGISSFDSDGFTTGNFFQTNDSGDSYVSWGWKANGTASSNTDGSITSTVSANTTSGFSIVSWTGNGTYPSTVGHGLGVAPKMIIIKPRNLAYSWLVYNENIGNNNLLYLEGTNASSGTSAFNNTSPTSSVFTVNDVQGNQSSGTYIAYCFAEKKGFSKFGSYVGNGSNDGSYIWTGFKPAWVMLKRSSASGENWYIKDNKRNIFNPVDNTLYANSSASEISNWGGATTDYLSNGFKLRTTDSAHNGSGATYIYMAFAENPFVTSTGIPATAR